MGFVIGRTVRLEFNGRALGVEEGPSRHHDHARETVIPGPYTGATQQDRPAKAAEKEPAMGSANTSTLEGMMAEVVQGLSRRGHSITGGSHYRGDVVNPPSEWITVEDEDGNRYTVTVERTR